MLFVLLRWCFGVCSVGCVVVRLRARLFVCVWLRVCLFGCVFVYVAVCVCLCVRLFASLSLGVVVCLVVKSCFFCVIVCV